MIVAKWVSEGLIMMTQNRGSCLKTEIGDMEDDYCQIVEPSPIGKAVYDRRRRYIACNPAYCKMYGRSEEDLVGKDYISVKIPKRNQELEIEFFDQVASDRPQLVPFENINVRADGQEIIVRYFVDHIRDKDGIHTGLAVFVEDVTGRKRAEAKREQLTRALESKNKELQSLISVVSHDLRTSLSVVSGFSDELASNCKQLQVLLQDVIFDEDKAQKANTITNGAIPESLKFVTSGTKRMIMVLDGILESSRVGTAGFHTCQLDINKALSHVVKAFQLKARECSATITVDDLPGCLGDGAMISLLFSNLIDNALKYLDLDRKGKIHISGRTEGKMSIYCVEDNGIGIDPEHQGNIFEVFRRLNPVDSIGGEGLGLSIVLHILDRLDGTIRIESETGKGSRFFVSLPTVKA
jgi:two-component system, chemotaxis family, sensor kinase Cph1